MEFESNQRGTSFKVNTTDTERRIILGAIAEVGLWSQQRDGLNGRPADFALNIIRTVRDETEWERETLETVGATLETFGTTSDAKILASRAGLGMDIKDILSKHPVSE